MVLKILLLFGGTVLAFWISAICGGGASLLLLPILNLLLPASLVPFSLTVGTLTSSASRIVVFRQHINWSICCWFVPFSIPAVMAGAWLIKYLNPLYLQFAIALFLIANLPQLFKSKQATTTTPGKTPRLTMAVVGFLAGFVSGVTGAIGLLFNRVYLQYGLTKESIVATRAANEICLHLIKLVIYLLLGLYDRTAIWLGLAMAAAAVLSSVSVRYILPFFSEGLFRKIGYGMMVLSGVVLLVNSSNKIIHQDKLHVATQQVGGNKETTISWRESDLVLEYAWGEELEIERPIQADELPPALKAKYDALLQQYDEILLEKVFRFRKAATYEFYCYKRGRLEKFEFADKP